MNEAMPLHEERELPSFTLRQIDLPEVITWEIGSQHYIVLKVEMTGKRNRTDMTNAPNSDQVKLEADFRTVSVKAVGYKPLDIKSLEKKEFNKVVAKALSGED
jgi:hypothetical protein